MTNFDNKFDDGEEIRKLRLEIEKAKLKRELSKIKSETIIAEEEAKSKRFNSQTKRYDNWFRKVGGNIVGIFLLLSGVAEPFVGNETTNPEDFLAPGVAIETLANVGNRKKKNTNQNGEDQEND